MTDIKLLPPAGWHTEGHLTDKSATTYSPVVRDRWLAKDWPVWPLYTADQVRANVLHHTAPLRYALDNAARDIKALRGVRDALAAEIERLRAEVERLTGCLATANANHEQFERQWYLERDRAERLAEALDAVVTFAVCYQLSEGDQCVVDARALLHPTAAQEGE